MSISMIHSERFLHLPSLRSGVKFLSAKWNFNQILTEFWISDSEKMAQYLEEERHMREENLRLQRKLQREMERREALCRQLSESESSLEMDDERCVSFSYPGMLTLSLLINNYVCCVLGFFLVLQNEYSQK